MINSGNTLYQYYWPNLNEWGNYANGDWVPHDLEYCVAIFRIKLKSTK